MPAVGAQQALAAESAVLNPHVVAGSSAIVIALLSLLVYLYRRRLFILWWVGAWKLLAAVVTPISSGCRIGRLRTVLVAGSNPSAPALNQ